ncbi:MAG: hypothetical protein K940chlam1_00310 [Candidatus Anoxychlamydiales bacterium]|nr:hypothetical protein [Candidatus Anoxychlamydiales bacterium]NGX36208.1 hypothetical protein [Candidatus Anoxychlamydiales bacterium]
MSSVSGSWFRSSSSTRPIDNRDTPSKILRVAIATLGVIAALTFFTAELAILATVVILGTTYFSLLRINNVYYRTVSPRPFFQRINPFWTPTPIIVQPRWDFWPRRTPVVNQRPASVFSGWGFGGRAPVGTGASSPIRRAPVVNQRPAPVFSGWGFGGRAPVGTGAPSPIRRATPPQTQPARPAFFRSPPSRTPPTRGVFHREPTRARPGERR